MKLKELLDSTNISDIILGLRTMTMEDLNLLFRDHNPEGFPKKYKIKIEVTDSYNILTDIGNFWMTGEAILYTPKGIGIYEMEITLNFKS